jgi:hypothetical protein
MPIGLPAEDGFLRAMIATSVWTQEENSDYIIFVEGTRHFFESRRRLRDVFRHHVRLTIGTQINVFIFNELDEQLQMRKDPSIYVKERNATDPLWLNTLVADELKKGRYFVINNRVLLTRFNRFRTLPLLERLRKTPIFVLSFMFDVAVFITANALMRRGAGAGFW